MRHTHFLLGVALAATVALSGCSGQQTAGSGDNTSNPNLAAHQTVPSGTSIEVSLATPLTSATASMGNTWTGTVLNGSPGIPAGSSVEGTVVGVRPAQKGDRAMLDLGLTGITVDGHRYAVHGSTEAIVAGSTRARNLGAIAGSAAAGALIGKAVSGSNKGTIIGAVVGGGAATGVVAASDGYQVVLKSGTPLVFTTTQSVAVRL